MAVPETYTTLDFSGAFTLNRELSGDTLKILELQGLPEDKRAMVNSGVVGVTIKQSKNEVGVEQFDVVQTFAGRSQEEARTLDWADRKQDSIFGPFSMKSRRAKLSELGTSGDPDAKCAFLADGWTADTREHGVLESYVVTAPENKKQWTLVQIWGVDTVNGERRYVRRVRTTTPEGDDAQVMMVYDRAD
ncbi:hypothetical protein BD626DRAFT_567010 [Schizophyllum amplum]|uniref:Uncharacterized protein n=1 Tax=Schizophyllum amplum TaxID=97359 RepID=A0A550CNL5_9AGAR|nr:hypothetical protein BD626DRAFT_567010 [Auriculariopsis ampla]